MQFNCRYCVKIYVMNNDLLFTIWSFTICMRDLTINKFIFITEGFIKNLAFYLLNRFALSFGWILKIILFNHCIEDSRIYKILKIHFYLHLWFWALIAREECISWFIWIQRSPPWFTYTQRKSRGWRLGGCKPPSVDWQQNQKKPFKYILPTIFNLFGIYNDH